MEQTHIQWNCPMSWNNSPHFHRVWFPVGWSANNPLPFPGRSPEVVQSAAWPGAIPFASPDIFQLTPDRRQGVMGWRCAPTRTPPNPANAFHPPAKNSTPADGRSNWDSETDAAAGSTAGDFQDWIRRKNQTKHPTAGTTGLKFSAELPGCYSLRSSWTGPREQKKQNNTNRFPCQIVNGSPFFVNC